MSKSLIGILRCPVSGEPMRWVDGDPLKKILAGVKRQVDEQEGAESHLHSLEAALITLNGEWLYPIEDGYPILLRDRAVRLATLE